ncbi:MAG: nitrogen fixation negative regulator NifL [Magnetospiraceae bacterium]
MFQDFIANPPTGTPEEIITILRDLHANNVAGLPVQVFIEAVAQSSVAISITDRKARILYANEAFQQVTGYLPEELVGKNESVLSFKATPAKVYEEMWGTITAGRAWTGTLINRKKSGERYVAELTVIPVRGPDGEVTHYMGLHRDVTQLHQLETELKNKKALLESVIDVAPVAIAMVDEEGRVELDNHAYKVLMTDLDLEPAVEVLAAVEEALGLSFAEIAAIRRDFHNIDVSLKAREERWFACSGTWVHEEELDADHFFRGSALNRMLLVCNDITPQRRRFEESRTSMVRALMAEQQRVASIREIIGASIYQLQGPLNLVNAAVTMLERQGDQHTPLLEALNDVVRSSRETLERLEAAMPAAAPAATEPVNVNEVIRDVLSVSTEQFLATGTTVDWQPTTVLASVPGNVTALRSLIKNVLDNAVMAVSEGGGSTREIQVLTRSQSDSAVEVEVRDTGPGIPPEVRRKVFEPFFCGWRNGQGHGGMGLTLAQQLATDQGGGITIEDSGVLGCVVRIVLSTRVADDRVS